MKKKYILTLFIISIFSVACGTTVQNNSSNTDKVVTNSVNTTYYPVTISNYNSLGEQINITFKQAPTRVFALHQNSIETLFALGVGDRIIVCAGDIPPDVKSERYEYCELFQKANYLGFQYEKYLPIEDLLVMNLDFILGWQSTFTEKTMGTTNFWHDRSVNTYIAENSNNILQKKTIESEYKYILDLGKIFDREEKASIIVRNIESELTKITKLTAQKKRQKAMVIELEKDNIIAYGEKYLVGDLITRLGADLIYQSPRINYEELLRLEPEVVFIIYKGDDGEKYVNQFLQTKSLTSLSCVKNKRVYAHTLDLCIH